MGACPACPPGFLGVFWVSEIEQYQVSSSLYSPAPLCAAQTALLIFLTNSALYNPTITHAAVERVH